MEQSQIEPGERSPAPGPLRVIQLFVNTNDLETGPDLLPDAGRPARLAGRARAARRGRAGDRRRPRARDRAARGDPRAWSRPTPGSHHDPAAGEIVNEAGRRAGLVPVLEDPATRFEPTAAGVDGALGHIVAAIHAAIAEGTWDRLKACERDICRWAFYDHSKNRSGHWCSMAVCGQREKNRRAYRRRRARVA